MTDQATQSAGLAQLLKAVGRTAELAGVFGPVSASQSTLVCQAKSSAESAEYRVYVEDGKLWISLVTQARWLSQSIEADLVHTGDKIEDLLEEELIDQGLEGLRLSYEHFRDQAKLYTFRSPLPVDVGSISERATAEQVSRMLLAYEATFRPLGDMEADAD